MLRVGLTGGLGSGKSTVARMLAAHGARVLQSDEIGRELMLRRNRGVYDAIVARFGPEVVRADGELDRAALAKIAFTDGRVEELNSIVHPAVIARQQELTRAIAGEDPAAVVVVESALIFETRYGGDEGKNHSGERAGDGGWGARFDRILLVTAPERLRIERYAERTAGQADGAQRLANAREAERRMSHQLSDEEKIALSDFVLQNNGPLDELQAQVDALWPVLCEEAGKRL